MSVTKELIEQERQLVNAGKLMDLHLHKEGSFLRAYEWSAWLCCHYLHDFKVNRRANQPEGLVTDSKQINNQSL